MRILFIILFASFFLTGCIEIIETIHINKDRSGSIEYRVNTSQASSWLGNISGMIDNSLEEQIRDEALQMVNILHQQEGISNVKYKLGKLSGDFFLQFDFKTAENYNKALYSMGGARKTLFSPGYLKISKHKIKKMNFTPWLNGYLKKENIEITQSFISDMITFSSIVEVPSEVKRVKPANVKVPKDASKVVQRLSFTQILVDKKSTGLRVKY